MRRQRGSAMLLVLIIVSALIAGTAVLVSLQMSSNRGAGMTNTSASALYCAEAGLSAARPALVANHAAWNGNLGTGVEPAWLASIDHDIDDNGSSDFTITLRDNDDEPTGANDPSHDVDQRIFVVSTCLMYAETPKQVTELVRYTGAALARELWLRTE